MGARHQCLARIVGSQMLHPRPITLERGPSSRDPPRPRIGVGLQTARVSRRSARGGSPKFGLFPSYNSKRRSVRGETRAYGIDGGQAHRVAKNKLRHYRRVNR
ncbi:hypothetical protein IF2G_04317 [Cordyceps javanica]|nr:hypothetical protein IF2G_04317 [Cordyceps javanica]